MNCQEVKELASDYLDRRLTPSQVVLLEEHVKSCLSCRQELAQLRAIISMTASLGEIETSPDFIVQVNRKIDGERYPGRLWSWFVEPMRIKLPLEAAALLLVSTFAFYLYHRSPELSQDSVALGGKAVEVTEEQGRAKELAARVEAPAAKPPAAPEVAAEKEMRLREADVVAALKQESRGTEDAPAGEGEAKQTGRYGVQAGKPPAGAAPATAASGATVARLAESKSAAGATATRVELARAVSPPPALEVITEDMALSERQVKSLVAELGGKVLSERASEDGLLLALELPVSRQAEFQNAVSREGVGERRKILGFSDPAEPRSEKAPPAKGALQAPRAALSEAKKSTEEKDEPAVRLELHIRQKR